jgi:hypothetical protein
MADLIWSCPDCGGDLDDDGDALYCRTCGVTHAPPAVMVPDDGPLEYTAADRAYDAWAFGLDYGISDG